MSYRKILAGSILGHVLENYDYALYGFFVPIIAPHFFPYHPLLAAFGAFAIGYVMRPLGGLLFGYIGDRKGRKCALLAAISLMSLCTFSISILPTYDEIGFYSPLLLILCRLLQGLSAGGEINGAAIIALEHASKNHVGFYGAVILSSGGAGILLAALTASIVSHYATVEWAWRLPFVFGGILGGVVYCLRCYLPNSLPYYENEQFKYHQLPLNKTTIEPRALLSVFGIAGFSNILTHTLTVYMNIYLIKAVNIPPDISMLLVSINLVAIIVLNPIMGSLSDKIGQARLMEGSLIFLCVTLYFSFAIMQKGSIILTIVLQMILSITVAGFGAPAYAFINEIFPPQYRYRALAFSYSLGIAVLGGTMPFISTWLMEITNNVEAPIFYIMACSIIGLLAVRLTNSKKMISESMITPQEA